jgi:tetratricopeptide (TPR) repeat protein/DNA-binding winged helix-turn-helix (wHTH) protein
MICTSQREAKERRKLPEIVLRSCMETIPPRIRCGGVEIDAGQECVRRSGFEHRLRRKSFQVLLYLIEHRHRVVSKDELFGAIWGGTAVTEDTLVQSVVEIRKALGDEARTPRFIRTMPKSGYRFVCDIECVQPSIGLDESAHPMELERIEAAVPPRPFSRGRLLLAAAVLAAIGVASALAMLHREEHGANAAPARPTVAVMFFEKRNGGADIDWLREGLSDMLITQLSRSDALSVISRGQLAALLQRRDFRAPGIPIGQQLAIARAANATRLITGTYAQLGRDIRIDAQVHDVASGEVLGGESLVAAPGQLLARIDGFSSLLASRLSSAGGHPGRLEDAMTDNLEAYRLYSLGVERAQAMHNREAIDLFQQAIALDPNFAMAFARIGYACSVTWSDPKRAKPYLDRALSLQNRLGKKERLYIETWRAIAGQRFDTAIDLLRMVIDRYPTEVEAYGHLTKLLQGEERLTEAEEIVRRGLAIDPSSPDLENCLGGLLVAQGRPAEAIAAHQQYVALKPNESNAHDSLGLDWQTIGENGKAIAEYNLALTLDPHFDVARVHLANAYFQMGRDRDAIGEFERYIGEAQSDAERVRGLESLAFVYRSRGQVANAEAMVRELRPGQGLTVRLMLALDRGDSNAARKVSSALDDEYRTSTIRGARPNLRTRLVMQGFDALNSGSPEAAIELFQRALRYRAPYWNFDDYEDCLGNAYLALGRDDAAAREYQRVLTLNPNHALARFHLARAYQHLGRNEEARREYVRFLQAWKDADRDLPELREATRIVGAPPASPSVTSLPRRARTAKSRLDASAVRKTPPDDITRRSLT